MAMSIRAGAPSASRARPMLRCVVILLVSLPAIAASQTVANVTIAVHVLDSASAPIADAEVSIVRDLSINIARGTTDRAGRMALSVPQSSGSLQLAVRKIGFHRAYRFFTLPSADSLPLEVRLVRSVVPLAPVTISASEDRKRKSYHLDADDIETSTRTMIDGTDIFKLRPDMMTSRGGAVACAVPYTQRDGWIESVWINGVRVVLPVVDSVYVKGREHVLGIGSAPPRPNPRLLRSGGQMRGPLPSPFTAFSHIDTVLSILQSVKPEHIAEITYHDCFDTTIGKNHSDMAMFIVLKPGVGYENGTGSYVIAGAPTHAARSDARASGSSRLPDYRLRVAGVFDADSGDPLPGVDVIDTLSGTSAKTTTTGTVSLAFVPEGTRVLRLHRESYRDTTFTLTIAPADTAPLTLVLTRQRPP
jgi:hypothetical protein